MLKLKAGALQLVLFVAVIVILLLSAFTLLVHAQKQFYVRHTNLEQAIKQTNFKALSATGNVKTFFEEDALNPYFNTALTTKPWGIFELISTSVEVKSTRIIKGALTGTTINDPKSVLYLKDNEKPLVLVGEARIKGNAYLPKQGVKPGQISGESYFGSQLIYGQTKNFKAFPKLNDFVSTVQPSTDKTITKPFNPNKSYTNSFNEPLLYLFDQNPVILEKQNYVGHIVIKSATKIKVEKTAQLKDVILIAPEIAIEDFTSGYFQAFATKAISVGKHCQLNYPTALVLKSSTPIIGENKVSAITIGEQTQIKGVIAYFGKENKTLYDPQITISEDAIISGQIYCEDKLDLRGTVYGQVMTAYFATKHEGVVYQNHLYNGKIISDALSSHYVGLSFENAQKEIGKWLY